MNYKTSRKCFIDNVLRPAGTVFAWETPTRPLPSWLTETEEAPKWGTDEDTTPPPNLSRLTAENLAAALPQPLPNGMKVLADPVRAAPKTKGDPLA